MLSKQRTQMPKREPSLQEEASEVIFLSYQAMLRKSSLLLNVPR